MIWNKKNTRRINLWGREKMSSVYISNAKEKIKPIRSSFLCLYNTRWSYQRSTYMLRWPMRHLLLDCIKNSYLFCLFVLSKFPVSFTTYFWPLIFYLNLFFTILNESNSCITASFVVFCLSSNVIHEQGSPASGTWRPCSMLLGRQSTEFDYPPMGNFMSWCKRMFSMLHSQHSLKLCPQNLFTHHFSPPWACISEK